MTMTKDLYIKHGEEYTLHAKDVEETDVFRYINEYCIERDWRIYYIRIAEHQDYKEYDFGSWSTFFSWGRPNEV